MDINQEIDDINGYTAIENVGNVPNTTNARFPLKLPSGTATPSSSADLSVPIRAKTGAGFPC